MNIFGNSGADGVLKITWIPDKKQDENPLHLETTEPPILLSQNASLSNIYSILPNFSILFL